MHGMTEACEMYRARTGQYPADTSSGVFPPELAGVIQVSEFENGTPIGGVWDTELNESGIGAGIGVHFDGTGATRDDAFMLEIDVLMDDGDLAGGAFQKLAADRFYYILESPFFAWKNDRSPAIDPGMSTLLHIQASGRVSRSITRGLTARYVRGWLARHPGGEVIERDVGLSPPTPVNEDWIAAAFTPPAQRTGDALAESDTLIDEIERADEIVIGTPMYNFGMPAALKAWVDQIVRIGRTFAFDPDADPVYRGLVPPRPVVVCVSYGDGALHPGGDLWAHNALEPHVRTVLGFIGLEDVRFVRVGDQEFGGERLRRSIGAAELGVVESTPDQLVALFYISQRAAGLDDAQIVDRIVLPAGNKNRRLGVTGCLWFGSERFAQVIEGAPDAIDSLYGEIERDARHTDVRLVWRGPIAERSFRRWGMKHIDGDDRDEMGEIVSGYLGRHGVTTVIKNETPAQIGSRMRRAFARLVPAH
eukprot:g5925.t1